MGTFATHLIYLNLGEQVATDEYQNATVNQYGYELETTGDSSVFAF